MSTVACSPRYVDRLTTTHFPACRRTRFHRPVFTIVAIEVRTVHIRGIPAYAFTAVVATGDFLFDDGPASCAIGLPDRFGGLGQLVGVNRLVAILDERLNIVLYLLGVSVSCFGESLCEILRDEVGGDGCSMPYVTIGAILAFRCYIRY